MSTLNPSSNWLWTLICPGSSCSLLCTLGFVRLRESWRCSPCSNGLTLIPSSTSSYVLLQSSCSCCSSWASHKCNCWISHLRSSIITSRMCLCRFLFGGILLVALIQLDSVSCSVTTERKICFELPLRIINQPKKEAMRLPSIHRSSWNRKEQFELRSQSRTNHTE